MKIVVKDLVQAVFEIVELSIAVFEARRPIGSKSPLNTGTNGPSPHGVTDRVTKGGPREPSNGTREGDVTVTFDVSKRETASGVDEHLIPPRKTETTTD